VDLAIDVSTIDVSFHQVFTLGMVAYFEHFYDEFKDRFTSFKKNIEALQEEKVKEKPPSMHPLAFFSRAFINSFLYLFFCSELLLVVCHLTLQWSE
jgi:hypothetical protein